MSITDWIEGETVEPTNDVEALALALSLAITAPDDAKAQQATVIAEGLAAGMSDLDVARAKKMAQEMAAQF